MKHILRFSTLLAAVVLMLCACTENKQSQLRAAIAKDIESSQDKLPIALGGVDMSIVRIELDGDFVCYTVAMDDYTWQLISTMGTDAMQSDENLARVIGNLDASFKQTAIDANIGLRYIYCNSETNETYLTIELSPERIQQIESKLASGAMEATSFLEATQKEFDNMTLPMIVDDGIQLTNAYIDGSTIVYEYMVDDMSGTADEEQLENMYEMLKMEIANNSIYRANSKSILAENVEIEYIYYTPEDEVWADITVAGSDVF